MIANAAPRTYEYFGQSGMPALPIAPQILICWAFEPNRP